MHEELRKDFEKKLAAISDKVGNTRDMRVYYIDHHGNHGETPRMWPELTALLEREGRIIAHLSEDKSTLEVQLVDGAGILAEGKMIPFSRICMIAIRIHLGVAGEEQFWFPRGGGKLVAFIND